MAVGFESVLPIGSGRAESLRILEQKFDPTKNIRIRPDPGLKNVLHWKANFFISLLPSSSDKIKISYCPQDL